MNTLITPFNKQTIRQDITPVKTISFLQKTPLFTKLSQQILRQISMDIIPRHYKAGEVIFHQGDPGQVLYLIQSGQIRIFINGLDGTETSVILFGKTGDIFGELAVVDGLPRSATAVALTPTTLYTISRGDFRKHMRLQPQLALNFMQELTMRVRYNTRQMDSFASLDVPQRVARKLVELAQACGIAETDGVRISVRLTQTELASMIGATRESINKCLREFKASGWIRAERGRITILDADALRAEVGEATK